MISGGHDSGLYKYYYGYTSSYNQAKILLKTAQDRFLRNMVRAIVGTLIEIGLGKITEKEFKLIIEKKDRQLAGFSVPAHALFLKKIDYDWDKILLNG